MMKGDEADLFFYNNSTSRCERVDAYGLTPFTQTAVGGYKTAHHYAIQNTIFPMARDAGLKAKQDPDTRDGFIAAASPHRLDEFRRSGFHGGGFR